MTDLFNILIVDDDPVIRETLSIILKTMGYCIRSVESGNDALELLSKERFDIVVLDVMMPEMDGWEVLKIIRDDPALEKTSVVLLTAKTSERDRLIGTKILKADEYISKPFDLQDFKRIIRKILGETRSES